MSTVTTDFYLTQQALGLLRRAEALLETSKEFYGNSDDPALVVRRIPTYQAQLLATTAVKILSEHVWKAQMIQPVDIILPPPVQRCMVCGCTEDARCPFTCEWFTPDLCSVCAQLSVKIVPDRT